MASWMDFGASPQLSYVVIVCINNRHPSQLKQATTHHRARSYQSHQVGDRPHILPQLVHLLWHPLLTREPMLLQKITMRRLEPYDEFYSLSSLSLFQVLIIFKIKSKHILIDYTY